jgi:hypothetical protein
MRFFFFETLFLCEAMECVGKKGGENSLLFLGAMKNKFFPLLFAQRKKRVVCNL